MTQPAHTDQPPVLEIEPQDFMSRLGSRLRINFNKETGRHTASFAGVYEKLPGNMKQVILGIGKTEIEACRALATKMRELHQIGRLQVLAEGATNPGPEQIVANQFSCKTR